MSTLKALYCGTDRWEERERERERNRKGQMERTEADSSETHSYITHGCLRFFSFFFFFFLPFFASFISVGGDFEGRQPRKRKWKTETRQTDRKLREGSRLNKNPSEKQPKRGLVWETTRVAADMSWGEGEASADTQKPWGVKVGVAQSEAWTRKVPKSFSL